MTAVGTRTGEFVVYNFEVESTHTYYAGHGALWVHNDCTSLARANLRNYGGEVRQLKRDGGGYIKFLTEPLGKQVIRDEFGMAEPWYYHDVHVLNGEVRDPMMLGHNKPIAMDVWKGHYGDWDDMLFFRKF